MALFNVSAYLHETLIKTCWNHIFPGKSIDSDPAFMTKLKKNNPPKPKFGDVIRKKSLRSTLVEGVIICLESLAFDFFETIFYDGKIGRALPQYGQKTTCGQHGPNIAPTWVHVMVGCLGLKLFAISQYRQNKLKSNTAKPLLGPLMRANLDTKPCMEHQQTYSILHSVHDILYWPKIIWVGVRCAKISKTFGP